MTVRIQKALIKEELLAARTLGWSILIALLYLFLSTLLLNSRLVLDTISGSYPLSYKLSILSSLLMGVTTLYTPVELVVMLLLGFLTGINLVLVGRSLRAQKRQNGVASLGLGMIGVVASTGCASCGLTLFSFAAPTVSLSLAPFQGPLMQIVSFVLLSTSLLHTLNRRAAVCTITK
jgi:hypothetical protein